MLNASPAAQLLRPIVLTRPIRLVEPNSWVTHIPFAFWVVDALRPRVVVELGTQSGNSYAALVQAVQALNLEAACYAVDTWQGDPQAGFYGEDVFAEWAAFHDRHFAGCSRLMRTTFDEARAHFSDDSIDLLHIDGLHTLEAVRHDFETWRGALSARGVVLFHDINVRELEFGAWRLWEEVRDAYPSFAFTHGHGLGVLAVGGEAADDLRWLTGLRNDDEGTALARRFFTASATASACNSTWTPWRPRVRRSSARVRTSIGDSVMSRHVWANQNTLVRRSLRSATSCRRASRRSGAISSTSNRNSRGPGRPWLKQPPIGTA